MDKQQLEARVRELEKWRQEKTAQQISFPLDNKSVIVLGKYFLSIVFKFAK